MKPRIHDVIIAINSKEVFCTCTFECKEQLIHHDDCPCPEHYITYKDYLKQFTKKELIEIINNIFK